MNYGRSACVDLNDYVKSNIRCCNVLLQDGTKTSDWYCVDTDYTTVEAKGDRPTIYGFNCFNPFLTDHSYAL